MLQENTGIYREIQEKKGVESAERSGEGEGFFYMTL